MKAFGRASDQIQGRPWSVRRREWVWALCAECGGSSLTLTLATGTEIPPPPLQQNLKKDWKSDYLLRKYKPFGNRHHPD